MKLKAQIIAESDAAHNKMREALKAAENDTAAHDEAIYYEGIKVALDWVLESRNENNHCV